MRLLNVKSFLNSGDLPDITALEEFVAVFPAYTILSHTWTSAKDEYLFEDLKSRTGQDKRGYEKVRNSCKIAADDGYNYVWVDSLCIDKSSSAELSEAINSMFAWYERSSVCYAYLDDVFVGNARGSSLTLGMLKDCRWITRGWTLQELIAPERVVFYDSNWEGCGDRESLAAILEEVTGIDSSILHRQPGRAGLEPLFSCSISKRMSWASKRRTTRPEDAAYCLLGIFGANMAMLYGEGGDQAFYRLQEEIMKHSTDQTIFAWSPEEEDPSQTMSVLATSPAAFVDGSMILPIAHNNAFEMTNKGLRIVAKKVRSDDVRNSANQKTSGKRATKGKGPQSNNFLILLNCYHVEDPFSDIAINVERLKNDPNSDDVFSRVVGPLSKIPLKLLRGQGDDTRADLLSQIGRSLPHVSTKVSDDGKHVSDLSVLRDATDDRLEKIYKYLKTEPVSLYITHLPQSLDTGSTSSTYCYLDTFDNDAGFERRTSIEYFGVAVSDIASDGSRTAIIRPSECLSIRVSEKHKVDLPDALLFIVVLSCSVEDPSRLEVSRIECNCGPNARKCATRGNRRNCATHMINVEVSLKAERISGRVCNDVSISVATDFAQWYWSGATDLVKSVAQVYLMPIRVGYAGVQGAMRKVGLAKAADKQKTHA